MRLSDLRYHLRRVGGRSSDAIVATTPHGTYTFGIRHITRDPETHRLIVHLEEIHKT